MVIFTSLVFVLLLICAIFSSIKLFSYVSLLVYLAYWLYMYYVNKTYFVRYLAFIFVALVTVVGASIIEIFPEIYLTELVTHSHFPVHFLYLFFSYWIFLYVLELREYRFERSINIQIDFLKSSQARKVLNLLSLLFVVLCMILLMHVAANSPPALFQGIDRFSFLSNYKMPWFLLKVKNQLSILVIFPMLSLIYANRFISGISLGLYCVYYFWLGEKFGMFFSVLCIF